VSSCLAMHKPTSRGVDTEAHVHHAVHDEALQLSDMARQAQPSAVHVCHLLTLCGRVVLEKTHTRSVVVLEPHIHVVIVWTHVCVYMACV
jgi:hypothetical protein